MRIIVDATKCTGCKCCELICSFNHSKVFNPRKSCIKVVDLDYLGFSNPVLCIQCKRPICVEVCPKRALSQTEAGIILIDEARCDGCRLCTDACIIGAINFDEETGLPLICNLCGGNQVCVEWCPGGALSLINNKSSKSKKELSYSLDKVKPLLNKRGIPESDLDWYRKFA